MLENMFLGRGKAAYDRILDFSTAVTGGLLFVPSANLLADPPAATNDPPPAADGAPAAPDGPPAAIEE